MDLGKVLSVKDGIVIVSGIPTASIGEILNITSDTGRNILCMVLSLNLNDISAVLLEGNDTNIREGLTVTPTGKLFSIRTGGHLLGHVVDPFGHYLDSPHTLPNICVADVSYQAINTNHNNANKHNNNDKPNKHKQDNIDHNNANKHNNHKWYKNININTDYVHNVLKCWFPWPWNCAKCGRWVFPFNTFCHWCGNKPWDWPWFKRHILNMEPLLQEVWCCNANHDNHDNHNNHDKNSPLVDYIDEKEHDKNFNNANNIDTNNDKPNKSANIDIQKAETNDNIGTTPVNNDNNVHSAPNLENANKDNQEKKHVPTIDNNVNKGNNKPTLDNHGDNNAKHDKGLTQKTDTNDINKGNIKPTLSNPFEYSNRNKLAIPKTNKDIIANINNVYHDTENIDEKEKQQIKEQGDQDNNHVPSDNTKNDLAPLSKEEYDKKYEEDNLKWDTYEEEKRKKWKQEKLDRKAYQEKQKKEKENPAICNNANKSYKHKDKDNYDNKTANNDMSRKGCMDKTISLFCAWKLSVRSFFVDSLFAKIRRVYGRNANKHKNDTNDNNANGDKMYNKAFVFSLFPILLAHLSESTPSNYLLVVLISCLLFATICLAIFGPITIVCLRLYPSFLAKYSGRFMKPMAIYVSFLLFLRGLYLRPPYAKILLFLFYTALGRIIYSDYFINKLVFSMRPILFQFSLGMGMMVFDDTCIVISNFLMDYHTSPFSTYVNHLIHTPTNNIIKRYIGTTIFLAIKNIGTAVADNGRVIVIAAGLTAVGGAGASAYNTYKRSKDIEKKIAFKKEEADKDRQFKEEEADKD